MTKFVCQKLSSEEKGVAFMKNVHRWLLRKTLFGIVHLTGASYFGGCSNFAVSSTGCWASSQSHVHCGMRFLLHIQRISNNETVFSWMWVQLKWWTQITYSMWSTASSLTSTTLCVDQVYMLVIGPPSEFTLSSVSTCQCLPFYCKQCRSITASWGGTKKEVWSTHCYIFAYGIWLLGHQSQRSAS